VREKGSRTRMVVATPAERKIKRGKAKRPCVQERFRAVTPDQKSIHGSSERGDQAQKVGEKEEGCGGEVERNVANTE